jgi:membrane-associated protein
MNFVKFTRSATLGAMIWVLVCVLAGYFFGNIPLIKNHLGLITVLGLGVVILVFLFKKVWDTFTKPKQT